MFSEPEQNQNKKNNPRIPKPPKPEKKTLQILRRIPCASKKKSHLKNLSLLR